MILVLGGTGKTGGRVASRLKAQNVPIRIGSRSATPAFEWEDPSTWTEVLKGVDAVYICYYPDLIVPGAAATVEAFARLAVQSGVKRLVLLSGRGEDGALEAEDAIKDLGAEWTIVRASWFFQNFSESFLLEPVMAGELALPTGQVTEPFIDADDIADIAVAALTQAGHAGQLYEVTGPRLMTFGDVTDELSRITGKTVRYVPISHEAFAASLKEQGVPPDDLAMIQELFLTVLDGRNSYLSDGVQRALGRAPRDFQVFAETAFPRSC